MVQRSDGDRPIAGGHVLKKAYETLDAGPLPAIRINRERYRDIDKAIKILDGLYNVLEVAMVDDEHARFNEAMTLLRKSQGGS